MGWIYLFCKILNIFDMKTLKGRVKPVTQRPVNLQVDPHNREELVASQEIAQIKLEEFLSSRLEIMDAMDIAYYSELTGISPSDLRKMHPCNDLDSLLATYHGNDTDEIYNIY